VPRDEAYENITSTYQIAMLPLPPRYAFRLEDLRVWHIVEAACPVCRHRAVTTHTRLTNG
jgi:hypothetical protein